MSHRRSELKPGTRTSTQADPTTSARKLWATWGYNADQIGPQFGQESRPCNISCCERYLAYASEMRAIQLGTKSKIDGADGSVTSPGADEFPMGRAGGRLNAIRTELLRKAASLSLDQVMTLAIDGVVELTGSAIGFYHFVEPDGKSIVLQEWSTRTKEEFCKAEGKGLHYAPDEAGVWVDCVHQKAPVIHNDYASLPHKKGLPEGHAPVVRELVVPVMLGEQVVAILGVGNKETDYTEEDAEAVSYLADVTWHIIELKRSELAHQKSKERLRMIFEAMPIGWAEHRMVFDADGRPIDYEFLDVNAAFERFTGLTRELVVGKLVTDIIPGIQNAKPDLITLYGGVVTSGIEQQLEIFFPPLDRWYKITAFTRRQGHFVAMFEDISDRKRSEIALQEINASLARSNRDLEQFAYVASHDLQEPLRMVASYTQLLAQRYRGELDERADRYIAYAVDGATRMQGLISDLLMYSRVGANKLSLVPVDCQGLVTEVVHGLKRRIEETRTEVTFESLPTVLADRTQLGQVFQNLISNAIKFCRDESPRITITAQRVERCWKFSVTDNGIGIEPRFHERIFLIFKRLHPREEYKGSGIGLSIVKKIIEGLGGEVAVESELGKGTTFSFTIPEKGGE
jgi:PAS domain S-box-containing protein